MIERGSVENIVLFVGDAVRYDESRGLLSELGVTYKTVAASLHTPASFASLLTGLNVPSHGVTGFDNVLPEKIPSLMDSDRVQTAFSAKTGTMHEDLHRIFRTPTCTTLENIEPPFVWVVRDPGGHAPYNGYQEDTYEQINETGGEYFRRVAGDEETIQRDYRMAVSNSIERFKDAIETIRRRGLSDETLLIYTSDHGELLAEYGLLGHNHIACPELVYVPTTFVHPNVETREADQTFRNIDVVPTVLDFLGRDPAFPLDGVSIRDSSDGIGYNHFEMAFYNNDYLRGVSNEIRSCWSGGGGHVFVQNNLVDSLAIYAGLLFGSHNGKHMFRTRTFRTLLSKLLPGHKRYGNPSFTKARAESVIEQATQTDDPGANRVDLDEETKTRLDDLGYL